MFLSWGTAFMRSSTENVPDLYPASAWLACAPAIVPPVASTLILGSANAAGANPIIRATRNGVWHVFMALSDARCCGCDDVKQFGFLVASSWRLSVPTGSNCPSTQKG